MLVDSSCTRERTGVVDFRIVLVVWGIEGELPGKCTREMNLESWSSGSGHCLNPPSQGHINMPYLVGH